MTAMRNNSRAVLAVLSFVGVLSFSPSLQAQARCNSMHDSVPANPPNPDLLLIPATLTLDLSRLDRGRRRSCCAIVSKSNRMEENGHAQQPLACRRSHGYPRSFGVDRLVNAVGSSGAAGFSASSGARYQSPSGKLQYHTGYYSGSGTAG